ncbi:Alpha/Beta hydrolase protein [Aspergillus lucknowensis]|uniref:Alpha/Beta hydrolase protein n=1 Tax=Aspergillus lucknowensis TaxID=176173 RepID=A0ABR4LT28_9EURO
MANKYIQIDNQHFPFIVLKNADIPLKSPAGGVLRCSVFLPKDAIPFGSQKYPVVATYGPYGKDVPYAVFNSKGSTETNPENKSMHSASETPDPAFWTGHGYIVVRVDEKRSGHSSGKLDILSHATIEDLHAVVEWCADQECSTGKVGLLGSSYYATTQWMVGARKPEGCAATIPWEGVSDYYREGAAHGGILADRSAVRWLSTNALIPALWLIRLPWGR